VSVRTLHVVSAQYGQYYHRLLYDRLRPWVEDAPISSGPDGMPAVADLHEYDLFHLHSPEDLPIALDLAQHVRFGEVLAAARVPIVWTQHNFEPHDKTTSPRFTAIYEHWAGRADLVFHHSRWGMAECRKRYPFSPFARHHVVHHGHFGPLMPELNELDPRDCRAELGLDPDLLCLGVIGHPRAEKQVMLAVRAFLEAGRDDMQLLVLSLSDRDEISVYPRVVALQHEPLPRPDYNRRLRSVDVALMPFRAGMLTTGSAADVIGLGIPAITSEWPYLSEVLGEAAIIYGSTQLDLACCLATLTGSQLDAARDAVRALKATYDYGAVAQTALPLLQQAAFVGPLANRSVR
jgi:hypothetical protein